MPVHFAVADHDANPVTGGQNISDARHLLDRTWGRKVRNVRSAELLQTSVVQQDFSAILAEHNGFVNTITRAYNHHVHLTLRPDDVWIAILGQLSIYVNAHAEDLRHHFVSHGGKKELIVKTVGTRYTVNFGDLAEQMTGEIHKNLVDPSLRDWILPDFTTTSQNDTVVCAVLIMSTMKAYFDFKMSIMCGIPSVTLEGEKLDWEKLLSRLDKLNDFGPEPTAWAALLRPILTRFVKAFDGEPDIDFWSRVCHFHSGGSGPTYLSGWLSAFCVWSNDGKWLGQPLSEPQQEVTLFTGRKVPQLSLDGVFYPIIDDADIANGFCEVEVKLDDNGDLIDCLMVSGHLASLVEGKSKDSIRPMPSWFIFVKEKCQETLETTLAKLV